MKKNKKNLNHSNLVEVIARQVKKNQSRLDKAEEEIKVSKKILNKILKKHGI